MKRAVWIFVLGFVAFAVVLIARLPADWIVPHGPRAPFACAALEGSLWSGTCSGLSVQGRPVGELSWELRPLTLLRGRLGAHVTLSAPAAQAAADAEVGLGGTLSARNLRADLTLDPALLPGVPPQLHGQAHLDLPLLLLKGGALRQLKGTVEAHDLEERSGNVTRLGSYAVSFPGGDGEPVGQIKDLGGPLSLQGTLRFPREGGYDLQGSVATRPEASPELISNLRFLGSPDASGRRQFTMSGTF
ncbi:MAG TPA: type II secretion system protein N [Steroidobacteraceae bacterium]|nr:type II secretion system protein N [Steroidobacteraceae bacterium]